MFARYAYPPNELGYCGPPSAIPYDARFTGESAVRLARRFAGAWCYLQTIAFATGYANPLDRAIVEAYWLGGPLLEQVDGELFAKALSEQFRGQHGARMAGLADGTARAHHGFHVFEVYPWSGMLEHTEGPALTILDNCRIRWGTVIGLDGDRASVLSKPLCWDGAHLHLGQERVERPRWRQWESALVAGLAEGDEVALHWDWVCDRLGPEQLEALRDGTEAQLRRTSRAIAAQDGRMRRSESRPVAASSRSDSGISRVARFG